MKNSDHLLLAILIIPALIVTSCEDTNLNPTNDTEILYHASFRQDELDQYNLESWNLHYQFEGNEILLHCDGMYAPTYGGLQTSGHWNIEDGYLYTLTFRLKTYGCFGGIANHGISYCGIRCNGDSDKHAWIITELADVPTQSRFQNQVCGWESFSETLCDEYVTYKYEITRDMVKVFVLRDEGFSLFGDQGPNCSDEIETIKIKVCLETYAMYLTVAVDEIVFSRIVLVD